MSKHTIKMQKCNRYMN